MADSITKISGWHPISISKLIKIIPSICQFPIIWQPHACLEKWMGLAGLAWWCGITRQAHRFHHNAIFSRQASNTSVTSHRHHCIIPSVHKMYLTHYLLLTSLPVTDVSSLQLMISQEDYLFPYLFLSLHFRLYM